MKIQFLFLNAFLIVASGSGWQPVARTSSRIATGRCMVSSSASSLPDTSTPLHPHTFAGLVERGLLERFEEKDVERVLQSWRLLDKDYFHKEYLGEAGKEDSSDMVQECHSYLPGLSIQPFWNSEDFDWAEHIKSKYSQIRKEFLAVNADMQRLQEEGNNVWAGALTEDASSYGKGWKTLGLMDRGRWDPENVNLFPNTAKIVHESGVPATEVFFASMKGPSEIKKHTDFTNFVLTSHLALDIPYSGENKCRISVGDETHQWINGNVMVFDTSLIHDAVNESHQMRYILMLRLWHPDLTAIEREALQFTYDCLELPGLVSDNPEERFMADNTAKAMKAFPQLKQQTQGFGGKKSKGKKKKKGGAKSKGFGI
jgi:aspartate beta-hydroxylase